MIDQRKIPMAILGLGAYRFPWWHYDPTPRYTAVGYFRADVFRPGAWVPTYPNPAFEKMTLRDAYWGAKIVMSFSDADLRAIVETARISTPEAEAHLIEVLRKRRDKIGRYWFDRVNPLDRFSVDAASGPPLAGSGGPADPPTLTFDDLAVTGDLAPAEARRYTYRMMVDDEPLGPAETATQSRVPLSVEGTPLREVLDARNRTGPHQRVVRVDLRTLEDGDESPRTQVYVYVPADAPARVVGLRRR
jgi:hypothetical protein